MMNFEQLGRSLSKTEQKHIYGGLDQEGIVCSCLSGSTVISSSICVGPADRCVGAAVAACDGNRVICGDGATAVEADLPDLPGPGEEPIVP